jgi:hypothetical protein
MVLLQAMLGFPIFVFFVFGCVLIPTLFIVLNINAGRKKRNPECPKYIAWYWIILVPIIAVALTIVYVFSLPDEAFMFT